MRALNTMNPSCIDSASLHAEMLDLRARIITSGIDYQVRFVGLKAAGLLASQTDLEWANRNRRFVGMAAIRLGEIKAELDLRGERVIKHVLEKKIEELAAKLEAQRLEIDELKRHTHVGLEAVLLQHTNIGATR